MGKLEFLNLWKQKTRELKIETYALYFATRDPRLPWYVKGFIALIVAYAFSPIDLIPDFIPVLGYLDDLVIVPIGIYFALRMIPPQVMMECRAKARERLEDDNPQYKFMVIIVIFVWVLALLLVGLLLVKAIHK